MATKGAYPTIHLYNITVMQSNSCFIRLLLHFEEKAQHFRIFLVYSSKLSKMCFSRTTCGRYMTWPKSMRPKVCPSSSSKMLPGCGSALKHPSWHHLATMDASYADGMLNHSKKKKKNMALRNSSSQGAMRICCPWIAISISKIPPTCGMRWNLCKDSVHFRIYIESIADPRQRFPDGQQYISLFGTPMASFLHLKPRNVQGLQVVASKRFPQSMTPVPKDDFPVEPPSLRSRLKRGISIKFSQKKHFQEKKMYM